MKLSSTIVLASVLAIGSLTPFSAATELMTNSLATVKANVEGQKAVLVDVREESEWDDGHIEGSISPAQRPEASRSFGNCEETAQGQDFVHVLCRWKAIGCGWEHY